MPEEQQSQLVDWLLGNMPYHQAKALLQEKFCVSTSLTALSAFWATAVSHALIARRQQAVTTADEIAEEARKKPGQFDSATLDAIKQKAFAISVDPRSAPGEVKSLFGLLLKAKDQELNAEQLKLDRERFEFDAARAALAALPDLRSIASDRSLDNNAKLNAVRKRLFGAAPE